MFEVARENAGLGSLSELAAGANLVVVAVPWNVSQATLEAVCDLSGKVVVINCTNPIAPGLQLALGTTTSGGEQVAQWAKEAWLVKTPSTIGWKNIADPIYARGPTLMLICSNDANAKTVVT